MMPHPHTFDRVVSVACLKDIETWAHTAPKVLAHIASRQYLLITPDQDVSAFRRATPSQFAIEPESRYLRGHSSDSIRNRLPEKVRHRAGWYLQQFVKLEACKLDDPSATALIWDADTVPLKNLNFQDAQGRLNYYSASEHHKPYFDTITKLLGLNQFASHSFVAQCLPVKAVWVHELFAAIGGARRDWIDMVLAAVEGHDISEFSEYETLGNFIFAHHPREVAFADRDWLRTGNSSVGSIASLSRGKARKLARRYDFVSFENWDPVRPTHWQRVLAALNKVRGGKSRLR